jgi:hypothetical protein
MNLRDELRQWQRSEIAPKRWTYHVANAIWQSYQFVSDPERRAQRVTQWRFGQRYYQRSTFTAPNRYPALFEQCRAYLSGNPSPRILSFGCSTGDEVFSFGEYLPSATILGVDINDWCLRQCNSRKKSDRHSFCHRFSESFERARDFDAVFCLAVFQRTENRTGPDNSVSTGLRFRQFEQELVELDAKLNREGLLVIDHADYSFADTAAFERYEVLDFEGNATRCSRPLFDKDDSKVSDKQFLHRVFVKKR